MSIPPASLTRKMSQVRVLLRPQTRKGGLTCIAGSGPSGRGMASGDFETAKKSAFSTFLFRCMAHNAIAALVIAVAYMGALATAEQTQPVDSGPTLAEQLAADHDCWTDEAPADMKGKRPGHAVVSDSTGRATYSRANVRIALEHVFEGKYPAITVHAFCR